MILGKVTPMYLSQRGQDVLNTKPLKLLLKAIPQDRRTIAVDKMKLLEQRQVQDNMISTDPWEASQFVGLVLYTFHDNLNSNFTAENAFESTQCVLKNKTSITGSIFWSYIIYIGFVNQRLSWSPLKQFGLLIFFPTFR